MDESKIAKIVEFGEAEAYADLLRTAPPDFAAQLGMRVEKVGTTTAIIMAGADIPLFNRVMGLGIAEPATEDILDYILSLYKQAGVRGMVQVAPSAQPAELPTWLSERGLHHRDHWVKVIRGSQPPPHIETHLRVERIGPDRAADHARIALQVFGMPPQFEHWLIPCVGRPGWTHYLACDGDTPISTAALFVKNQTAWFGVGSTLPSHRNHGGQSALFAARIEDAISAGCKWLVTETWEEHLPEHPNPSYHNMLRMGFELVYVRGNYLP